MPFLAFPGYHVNLNYISSCRNYSQDSRHREIFYAGSTVAVSRSEAVVSRTVTWRAWLAVTSGHLLLAVVGQVAAAASSRVL